jgi:hypothetical protein
MSDAFEKDINVMKKLHAVLKSGMLSRAGGCIQTALSAVWGKSHKVKLYG